MEKVKLQREVKQYTEALELHVLERTIALEETNTKLQESLAELKGAQEQLVQSEKLSALGELISGFAHELNNPLSSVLGYSELALGEEICPDEIRMMLELVCKETHRCYQIVENLLSFARKRKPEKTVTDINDLCTETLQLLSYQLRVNNISVTTNLAHTLPCTMADSHQLQQVLVNLLSNAYQAMAEDQGRGELTVTTTHDDEDLYITISDTGPGIATAHLTHLFDPFFTTKPSGTGLGLSLSYGIIKEHRGDIRVSSQPGEGATFTLVLPITPEIEDETDATPNAQDHVDLSQRVLVIDDEPVFCQMLVMALDKLGHRAEAMLSGHAAFEKLAHETYDLLICDLRMPEMDGQQVYQGLRTLYPDLCQRMIFTSGDTVSDEQQFVRETGCLFLRKPFVQKDLRKVLTQALVKSRVS